MTEVEQPPQNGIDLSAAEDDDSSKARPADIEQDMREMERRKRVEAIMSSKLFREELERIVDSARDSGGASGILQQLSDIVGIPASRVGSVYKASNCMMPINDIRGVESMGYAKGEKILRCKLAATFRLLDLYGWTQGLGAQITARLKVDQEYFLVNPYGLLYHEITASSLNKVDMQGNIVEQGTTNFGVNKSHFTLHSVVHAARPDIRCAIYIGCSPVVAISSLKTGLLPITKDACVLGDLSTYSYAGTALDADERNKLVRNLGPNSKVLLLSNYGALCCGETIEEAFYAACHIVQACETQLKLLPVGLDNLVLIPEESRKIIYEQSRRPPEDLEKKFSAVNTTDENTTQDADTSAVKVGAAPKWRVGGAEFEALMRMLDNAGYRTGYIYRHPLIKSEPPKPKNDVELPPAVSSLGYLLEEEELFRQGIWKKGDLRKGGDRSRWLNSPNVYQKVEVLETGTPDPKKITKWVAEGSPTHSTPVRIEDPLQFVPAGTTTKEFKRLQQQIKDNRRADKISAGPQSHILEGVTWDEANRIKDATVSSAGDHVVLMGAASKGIIQRGYQHNAAVYKAPYAKNPFDNVTDDELNEYKRTVERKKKSIHGEYTDTDFSESEALSSLPTSGAPHIKQTMGVTQSEPEDVLEHQVIRIQTQQAPVPSQPEVVLSDAATTKTHNIMPIFTYKADRLRQLPQKPNQNQNQQQCNMFAQKYAFLYENPLYHNKLIHYARINLFMIHKIDIFPHYTFPYPTNHTDNSNNINNNTNNNDVHSRTANNPTSTNVQTPLHNNTNDTLSNPTTMMSSPYRTVSHYGFNYPLTYVPNIKLHPANLLSAVELQRQKVIAFIKSTALNFERDLHMPTKLQAGIARPIKRSCAAVVASAAVPDIAADTGKLDSSPLQRAAESNGSFISVKEIQLNTKHARQRHHSKSTSHTYTCASSIISNTDKNNLENNSAAEQQHNDEHHHHHDDHEQFSEPFSSLLSIGGSYPAASNSHSVDMLHEHEHDHEHFDDSGDNCSRHAASENLYRSYVLRNFLPMQQNARSRSYEHDIRHKPEAEQAIHAEYKSNLHHNAAHLQHEHQQQHQQEESKHITLSLNALKRRASSERPRRHIATASVSETASNSQISCSTGSIKSLEIHINISIKNADCAKNLQTHEHEFKTKLEKVLDDEINLISQQLAQPTTTTAASVAAIRVVPEPNTQPLLFDTAAKQKSAPVATTRQRMDDVIDSTELKTSVATLHQRHILALLEHELENLLNSIIRANELHNRAVMCDCKTKISRITEDIRASLQTD